MANGDMGKKTSPEIRNRGLTLVDKGNTIQQVAKRMGVSESLVRNWLRDRETERNTALEEVQEPVITDSV